MKIAIFYKNPGGKMYRSLRAIVIVLFIFLHAPDPLSAQEYTIIDIPVNSTYHHVSARGINNSGDVVGSADASPWYGYNRGFVYSNGAINFIYLGSANTNPVLAINDEGNYVGQASLPDFVNKGFLNSSFLPSPFTDENFWVSDINNVNQICGYTWDGTTSRIVIFEGTQVIDIPNISFDDGVDVNAINDSGFVIGTRWETNEGYPFIYSHRDSQIIYLPNLAGGSNYPYTEAYDINNSNEVVGYYNQDNNPWGGFVYRNGSYTQFPYGLAQAINDSGVVVGELDSNPTMSGGEYAFIYDPVRGVRDLNTLIPAGSGWELLSAEDINDVGQIIGIGRLNGNVKSFILTPEKLTVTKPVAGELFIAGESDTIRWTGGGGIDSVRIIAVLNSHTVLPTEIVINENIPADSGEWTWNIPDSLLSYKTKIRIEDKNDPSTFAESGLFKLKGYVLTNVNPFDSTYEAYGRTKHAWKFGNTLFDMWPSAWWSRFTYRDSIDPYTLDRYAEEFHGIAANMFPDWPAFVRAYGVNQCYWSIPGIGMFYRDVAVNFWRSKIGSWGGSCFGFAISSILAFQDAGGFVISYPEMPSYNNLYDFPGAISGGQGDSIRSVINSLFTHQFGKQHWDNYLLNIWGVDRPTQTLNKLKSSLINDSPDGRVLRIDNQGGSGAHAIMVYKLTQNQSSPNLYTLSVYDNSYQTVLNATITIDTAANGGLGSWNSSTWAGWGGNIGIYLLDPAVTFFNQPIIPNGPLDEASPYQTITSNGGSNGLQINNTRNADILISDSAGNSIGFTDSALVSEIPGAIPYIPMEPSSSPPYGYQLPYGNYRVDLLSFHDSTAFLYVFDGPVTYSYWRTDAVATQKDNFTIGSGLSIGSSDPEPKSIELKTTISNPGDEKVFIIPRIQLQQSDSVHLEQRDQERFELKNFGSQKSYGLKIKNTSPSLRQQFGRENLALNQNSSHTIIPDWGNLQNQPVKILIDEGNDGIIDDSILVENEILGVDNPPFVGIPSEFILSQNYPNPFNAATVIEYGLPTSTHVTLKVYDVLGREVQVLVDEHQQAGYRQARWDASGMPSGVYYVRLTAGAFTEAKKMLLMK